MTANLKTPPIFVINCHDSCNERPQGRLSMTAPCAIEYILVTRWRGGKKGGQNRVCTHDTRVGS